MMDLSDKSKCKMYLTWDIKRSPAPMDGGTMWQIENVSEEDKLRKLAAVIDDVSKNMFWTPYYGGYCGLSQFGDEYFSISVESHPID
jgi:hypothetical protein